MKIEIKSKSPTETKRIGRLLAKKILKNSKRAFVSLRGNLGSGKTTFVKGFAKGMGIGEEVTSPTFLIYKKYKGEKELYHFDAYRIKEKDLDILNFKNILKEENIVIVEWSENIIKRIPKKRITVSFSFISPKKRRLIVEDNSGIMDGSFL